MIDYVRTDQKMYYDVVYPADEKPVLCALYDAIIFCGIAALTQDWNTDWHAYTHAGSVSKKAYHVITSILCKVELTVKPTLDAALCQEVDHIATDAIDIVQHLCVCIMHKLRQMHMDETPSDFYLIEEIAFDTAIERFIYFAGQRDCCTSGDDFIGLPVSPAVSEYNCLFRLFRQASLDHILN